MKRSLEHSVLPTVDEIKLYQEGKLSKSRTHEIELLTQENPMLADAIEGYAAMPLFGAMPGVTAVLGQKVVVGSSQGAAGILKSGVSLLHLNSWVVGLGVGVAATVATVVLVTTSDKSDLNENEIVESATISETDENVSEATTNYEEEINTQQIQNKDQVLSASVASEDAKTSEESVKREEYNIAPLASLETSGLKSSIADKGIAASSAKPEIERTPIVALGIVPVLNHRVVDYSNFTKKKWKLSDACANPGSAQDVAEGYSSESDSEDYLTYLGYIRECMDSYNKGNYKIAAFGFQHILSQYPDDLNALFYGAMSYYDNEQPVLALELLNKAAKNPISAFREETFFYQAKCLKMLNRIDESNQLFNEVIERNGDFRDRAEAELAD